MFGMRRKNPVLSTIALLCFGIIGLAILGPVFLLLIVAVLARQVRYNVRSRNRKEAYRAHRQAYAHQQATDERILAVKSFVR